MRSYGLIAAAAAGILVSAAAGAEPFSGPHVEALAGWSDGAGAKLRTCSQGTCSSAHDKDGVTYGGAVGYDLRFNSFVGGANVELDGTTAKSCQTYGAAASAGSPAIAGRECVKDRRNVYAGARLGYVAGSKTLLYVTGGYANLRESTRFDGKIGGIQTDTRDHKTLDGFYAGTGVEFAITTHAFVKGEYRYTNADTHGLRVRQNQLLTGVGFRF